MKVAHLLVALSISGLSAGAFAQHTQTDWQRDTGQPQRIDSSARNTWPRLLEAARRDRGQRSQIVVPAVRQDPVAVRVPVVVQRVEVRPIYVREAVIPSAESSHS